MVVLGRVPRKRRTAGLVTVCRGLADDKKRSITRVDETSGSIDVESQRFI
jgi:hypothetical protein